MNSQTKDMTTGVIWKELVLFSIPLIITNLLQQAYNTADLLIVSWLADDQAMAAIGATGSLSFMMLGLFFGFSIGASVIVAHAFGARDSDRMYRAIHTTYAVAILSGLILTVLAYIFAPNILHIMNTPENIFEEAVTYTRIYFMGSVPLLIYNMGTGILRSIGDSKTPLFYLVVSTVINIVLDAIFVGPLGMRAAGAAIATVIAQIVTALMLTIKLMRTTGMHKLTLSKIRIHWKEFKEIVAVGIPAGIQNSLMSFSNVLIQARTNAFGYLAVAGVSAANRYDAFMSVGVQSFMMAATTFTGQNYGAKKYHRLKKGARTAALMGSSIVLAVGILLIVFGRQLMGIFSSDPQVIEFGYRKMVVMASFNWIFAMSQIISGVIRGVGKSIVPMVIAIFAMVGVRTFWNYVVPDLLAQVPQWVGFARSIDLVFWSYPVSWLIATAMTFAYYLRGSWMPKDM